MYIYKMGFRISIPLLNKSNSDPTVGHQVGWEQSLACRFGLT